MTSLKSIRGRVKVMGKWFRKREQVSHVCPRCGKRQDGKSDPRGLRDYCWNCLAEGAADSRAFAASEVWNRLRELEKDWDSYGADPPSEHAIARAKAFLEAIADSDGPRIGPSVDGGVGVTIGAYYLEFCNEADEDGVEMIGVRMFKQ